MSDTPKSFAELLTNGEVKQDELLATLENYAESGATISGPTVVRIIAITECTRATLEGLLTSALKGAEIHQKEKKPTEAGEYESVVRFINSKLKSEAS